MTDERETVVYIELDQPDNIVTVNGAAAIEQAVALVVTQENGDQTGYPLTRVLSWAQTYEEVR